MKAVFVTGPLRSRLATLMSAGPVFAAVAYVSDVSGLRLSEGDLLVCDASDGPAKAGSTVKKTLMDLVDAGVSVWSLQDLHAKVVVCEGRAIIGSANWSDAAENKKTEAGIETDDPAVVAAAKTFVLKLCERGAVQVDNDFLTKMPDPEPKEGKGNGKATKPDGKIRHWLAPSSELPKQPKWLKAWDAFTKIHAEGDESFDDDGEANWYLYSSTARNVGRIAGGDTITVMYQSDDEETFVYPARRVLRAVHIEGFVGLLTLEVANEEKRKVPWGRFAAAAPLAGVRKNFTQDSHIELSAATALALEPLWAPKGKGKRKA